MDRNKNCFAALISMLLWFQTVGCSSSEEHLCEKQCTPAAICVVDECQCPGNFIPASLETTTISFTSYSGDPAKTIALGSFMSQSSVHEIALIADLSSVPTGQAISLATRDIVAIIIRHLAAHTMMSTSGTITFHRACQEGVTATVVGATFTEWGSNSAIDGGCISGPMDFSFALGRDG